MIELIKTLLGVREDYPENPDKKVTLLWCSGCGGWHDAMEYRFYRLRGYEITRKEAHHSSNHDEVQRAAVEE